MPNITCVFKQRRQFNTFSAIVDKSSTNYSIVNCWGWINNYLCANALLRCKQNEESFLPL